MATLITGRDLSLTINSVTYAAQASTVTLSMESNQQVVEPIAGRAYKTIDQTATLTVEMFQDWGAASSICEALWDATESAPDTAVAFTFDANGSTFTGNLFPVYPDAGGGSTDVLTTTLTFVVKQGTVARA